jgi:hypothetical protein
MAISKKNIQKAVAKSIVRKPSELVILIRKYRKLPEENSYADILYNVQDLLVSNNQFAKDYTRFLMQNKLIESAYNSAIGAVIASVFGVIGGAVQTSGEKKSCGI